MKSHLYIRYCGFALLLGMVVGVALPSLGQTLHGRVSAQGDLSTPSDKGVIGINFDIRPYAAPTIAEIYPGTPADKAGLLVGDAIIAIDSYTTMGLSLSEVDAAITDIPGRNVQFLVQRQGKVFSVNLKVQSLRELQSEETRMLYQNLFNH